MTAWAEVAGAAAVFLAAFAGMEAVAAWTHRHVMHGALWCWHRSHHEPRRGRVEANDLFAVLFAVPAIALIRVGVEGHPWVLGAGAGMTAYGLVYVLFHDGIVHRRWPVPVPRWRWLQRRVQAHRLHHALRTRDGALSFGFLHAPDPRRLRAELRARRCPPGRVDA